MSTRNTRSASEATKRRHRPIAGHAVSNPFIRDVECGRSSGTQGTPVTSLWSRLESSPCTLPLLLLTYAPTLLLMPGVGLALAQDLLFRDTILFLLAWGTLFRTPSLRPAPEPGSFVCCFPSASRVASDGW